MRHVAWVAVLVAAPCTVSCKVAGGDESAVKVISTELRTLLAADQHKEALTEARAASCNGKTMLLVVRNADRSGETELWGIPEAEAKAMADAADASERMMFIAVTQSSFSSQMFRDMAGFKCPAGSKGEILAVEVTDYHRKGDSEIFSSAYVTEPDGSWVNVSSTAWNLVEDKLVAFKGPDEKQRARLEIDVPRALPLIADQLSRYDIRKAPSYRWTGRTESAFGTSVHYDRILYVLKGHSGLVNTDAGYTPDLANLKAKQPPAGSLRHLMLFDATGPSGPIKSGVYAPVYRKDVIACVGRSRSPATDAACRRLAGTQGTGSDGDTLGGRADGDTQGRSGDGDTLGGRADGDTQGRPGDGDTLGGRADGDTQGPTGDGETLSPFGASGGLYQEHVSGTGKHTLFVDARANPRGSYPYPPSGLIRMGSAVSFDTRPGEIAGVHRLRLPAGKDKTLPTFVLVDSCYASRDIARAIENAGTVVVLANPKPLYMTIVDYGHGDSAAIDHLFAMPLVLGWGKTGGEKAARFRSLADAVIASLAKGIPFRHNQSKQDYARLSTSIYKDGRFVFTNESDAP